MFSTILRFLLDRLADAVEGLDRQAWAREGTDPERARPGPDPHAIAQGVPRF